jgi:hypothetical protein
VPVIDNVGVMINETLYYPGDSFVLPGQPVQILALPIGAPWLKISESIDFLVAIKPKMVFPTHDAVLSAIGKSISDARLSATAREIGAEYRRLDTTPAEL